MIFEINFSFEKMFSIFHAQELAQRRIRQLTKESEIDGVLENNFEHCPKTVLRFLILLRKRNREQALDIYNSNFWEYFGKIEKQLNENDHVFANNFDCEKMFSLINAFEKKE